MILKLGLVFSGNLEWSTNNTSTNKIAFTRSLTKTLENRKVKELIIIIAIFITFIKDLIFCIYLIYLMIFHVYLTIKGKTTIQYILEKKRRRIHPKSNSCENNNEKQLKQSDLDNKVRTFFNYFEKR